MIKDQDNIIESGYNMAVDKLCQWWTKEVPGKNKTYCELTKDTPYFTQTGVLRASVH